MKEITFESPYSMIFAADFSLFVFKMRRLLRMLPMWEKELRLCRWEGSLLALALTDTFHLILNNSGWQTV